MQAYLGGEKNAINQIIERHRARIFGYILGMVRNRTVADDIFQETIIKVVGSLDRGKYKDDGRLISWILRVAHNQVIDYFRSGKRRCEVKAADGNIEQMLGISGFGGEVFNGAETEMIESQTSTQIQQLVETLPAEQREVVVMRHFMDLSFSEIAEQTGVSINTALGRMRYALINLRKNVDRLGLELV